MEWTDTYNTLKFMFNILLSTSLKKKKKPETFCVCIGKEEKYMCHVFI